MKPSTLKTLLVSLLVLSLASPLLAGEEDKSPIKITSDRLVSDNKTKTITFIGNVKAVREDLTMLSEQVEILQDNSKNSLNMIVATGNVRINQKEKYATGEKAVYYEDSKKIVLTGNPRSWEGKNEITGEEMTFYLDEERLEVKQSEKKQVNVIFYPKKKND